MTCGKFEPGSSSLSYLSLLDSRRSIEVLLLSKVEGLFEMQDRMTIRAFASMTEEGSALKAARKSLCLD